MQIGIGPHLEDTDIEQYSMGILPEERLAPFEEHFLACDACQDRLLEMEAYVNAVRSVSPKLREASQSGWRSWFHWPRPVWVSAVALGVAASFSVIALTQARNWKQGPPAQLTAVLLHSARGIEGLEAARAPAEKPVSLAIDLTELPAFPSYRLETVNSMGKPMSKSIAVPQQGKITQPVAKGLAAGRYYVRLYSPGGELLREFGLQVE